MRRRLVYGPERQSLLVVDELDAARERTLQLHERLLDAPAVAIDGATLRAIWPEPRPATLQISRFVCPTAGVGDAASQVSCMDGVVRWVGPAGIAVLGVGAAAQLRFVSASAAASPTASGSPSRAAPQ